jgi:flagellar capping protein FliD
VSAVVTGLRTTLRSAVSNAFEADGAERIRSGFGLDFDFRAQSSETMDYSRSRLRSALATDTSEVTSYFADGENGEAGMLSSMIATLGGTMSAIEDTVGHIGLNVDVQF